MTDSLYIETSIFGFYSDPLRLNRGKRDSVRQLFKEIRAGRFTAICSDLVSNELLRSGDPRSRHLIKLIHRFGIKMVEINPDEVDRLADEYIVRGIIAESMKNDALHVAAATVMRVDILVSLNLRHIVKTWRERQFNGVNLMMGYPTLRIATPEEVVITP